MIQLVMINTICGNWIFAEKLSEDQKSNTDWIQFDIWVVLEACVFLSYICSGMVYLLIRSVKVNEYNLSI